MSAIYNINKNYNSASAIKREKSSLVFPDGFFNAKITEKSQSKVRFQASGGLEFEAEYKNFPGEEGDVIKFEAAKGKNGKVSLRFIENLTQNTSMAKSGKIVAAEAKELFKQSNFIKEENLFEVDSPWEGLKGQSKEEALAIARLKNQIDRTKGNLTMEVINQLLSSGVSIQNLSFDMVSGISGKLEGEVPDTPENRDYLSKAEELFEKVKKAGPREAAEIIKDGDKSLGGIYKAVYSGSRWEKIADSDWENLKPGVEATFLEEGIKRTKENMEKARFLAESQLLITKENMALMEFYSNLDKLSLDEVEDMARKALGRGQKPLDIELLPDNLEETYSIILENIHLIDDNALKLAEESSEPVTLRNLRTLSLSGRISQQTAPPSTSNKLFLAEITLRLTAQAAYNLAGKGINIDIMPLKEAVEALRAQEREAYAADLGAAASQNNIDAMEETYNRLRQMNPLTNNAIGDVVSGGHFTINAVHKSVELARKSHDATTEKFMTVPDKKYGDNFSHVADKFGPLLQELDIESTPENIRAAAILSRAGLDVNEENILQVKIIDYKLDYIQDTLHPQIAADLIAGGESPLDMDIDKLKEYIDDYNGCYGRGFKNNLAQHIYDAESTLEPASRAGLISLYKSLNTVLANGGAAIGVNIKAGKAPTLGSLLDSADYYRKTGAKSSFTDVQVDDGFTNVKAKETGSIRQVLSRQNSENMIKSIAEMMTPEAYGALNKDGKILESSVEEVYRQLKELSEEKISREVTARANIGSFKELAQKSTAAVLRDMEKAGLPLTFSNLQAYLQLKEEPDTIEEGIESLDRDGEFYKEIADEPSPEKIDAALDHAILQGKATIGETLLFRRAVNVAGALATRENNYNIPVKIEGKIRRLNVYIPGQIGDETQIYAKIDTEGKRAEFAIKAGSRGLDITASIDGEQDKVNETARQLTEFINQAGFTVIGINGREAPPNIVGGRSLDRGGIFRLGAKIAQYINYAEVRKEV